MQKLSADIYDQCGVHFPGAAQVILGRRPAALTMMPGLRYEISGFIAAHGTRRNPKRGEIELVDVWEKAGIAARAPLQLIWTALRDAHYTRSSSNHLVICNPAHKTFG